MTIKGIIPAIATPMFQDESVNYQELKNQVDRQIKSGAAAVFCLGTNGEFYALSFEEKQEIIRTVVQHANGRIPVLAGTGCVTTKETIALTKVAKEEGADGVSVITPYFAGLNQKGVYYHFSTLAKACDIPIILYNIPARTGVNIHHETVAELAKFDNIIGIKDSSGNFDNTLRYIEETPEDFCVLCGNDSLILWTLLAGGNGGISGIANLFPERMVSIYQEFAAGNLEAALEVQNSIRTIRNTLALHNPNSVVKRAANLLGHPVGPARAPFHLEDSTIDEKIKQALAFYPEYTQGGNNDSKKQ